VLCVFTENISTPTVVYLKDSKLFGIKNDKQDQQGMAAFNERQECVVLCSGSFL
jgi:hypothetical protein